MRTPHRRIIKYLMVGSICALLLSSCVAWVDRPPAPQLSQIPSTGETYTTITVVRKDQFALSGAIFTVFLDGIPIANLNPGQYTTFHASAGSHVLDVRWDIGGLNFIGLAPMSPGFFFSEPVNTYNKEIIIDCAIEETCFIGIEAKAFSWHEQDRVIIKNIERLDGDFSTSQKVFIPPGASHLE